MAECEEWAGKGMDTAAERRIAQLAAERKRLRRSTGDDLQPQVAELEADRDRLVGRVVELERQLEDVHKLHQGAMRQEERLTYRYMDEADALANSAIKLYEQIDALAQKHKQSQAVLNEILCLMDDIFRGWNWWRGEWTAWVQTARDEARAALSDTSGGEGAE